MSNFTLVVEKYSDMTKEAAKIATKQDKSIKIKASLRRVDFFIIIPPNKLYKLIVYNLH